MHWIAGTTPAPSPKFPALESRGLRNVLIHVAGFWLVAESLLVERILSENSFFSGPPLVPVSKIRIESVGVNPLDSRRIDVAVDLTPCSQPVDVEMVIVGPEDDELCSILMLQNGQWMLDKVMHLRKDPVPGEYTLHVGVFHEKELITRAERRFRFPLPESL